MNVYVIYQFRKSNEAVVLTDKISQEVLSSPTNKKINFFMFQKDKAPKHWKRYARQKLKKAHMVLFFDTIDETAEKNLKNIGWELKKAQKYHKKIVIVKQNQNIFSHELYSLDYADQNIDTSKYQIFNEDTIAEYLIAEANWELKDFLWNEEEIQDQMGKENYAQILAGQYQLMIQTSEDLMKRRTSTSNLYISLCSTLLTVAVAIFGIRNILISLMVLMFIGVLLITISFNWKKLLVSYEKNNEGKFEVINEIEKNLPVKMFDGEYRYNKNNGLQSFSLREKILPNIFLAFGICCLIITVIFLIIMMC